VDTHRVSFVTKGQLNEGEKLVFLPSSSKISAITESIVTIGAMLIPGGSEVIFSVKLMISFFKESQGTLIDAKINEAIAINN